jgi:ABC-type branched-subunit amino acid transport system substrate-binding protein
VEDDGYDSKKALSAYQKLTGVDNIDALISASSPSISAIYDLVTKTDMPVIQGGEQPVEPTDDNVFQIMPGISTLSASSVRI